jgi:Zn-dependent M28 family amino/carboxypeptidase
VKIGPRPAGSAELEKARALITKELERLGWEVERQEFTDATPRGAVKFVNLIARFSQNGTTPAPRDTQRAILCSHYDTKRYSTISFVGANDAGSSTGALIELARVLALDSSLPQQVELVFFDGEEAFVDFSETDGLYGSRYYARDLRESGRAKQFQFGILWDMIGEKDLTITLSPDSPKDLAQGIFSSAEALGLRSHFSFHDRPIWDDHVPLNRIRIPTINLIDFDYLYWHTADDKLDQLSPESLQKIGAVTLHYLRQALPAE